MIWGEAYEAILEDKGTILDRYMIWISGLAIITGIPWLLWWLMALSA